MKHTRLRIGAAGLGRAFLLMLPTFVQDERVQLVAAADPRLSARQRFAEELGGRAYSSVEELCGDAEVDAVYIATPHQFHAAHAKAAAACGKHVMIEKPMALSIAECTAMIEAARRAGVLLIVGHSHSFDTPILRTRALIESGEFGDVRAITAMNFTDFLYRPRRREELITSQGGGVIFSQAVHQIDIVRLLAGGRARSVRAETGAWDAARGSEGAYNALITFENGSFASAVYNGYGYFDSDEFCGWIGELGYPKPHGAYGTARRILEKVPTIEDEERFKLERTFGGGAGAVPDGRRDTGTALHQHFGFILVSCDRGDLRPTPQGVSIYSKTGEHTAVLDPPRVPRSEVVDELFAAIHCNIPPVHSGEWGRATLEVCLAILQSAQEKRDITLDYQIKPALPVSLATRPAGEGTSS